MLDLSNHRDNLGLDDDDHRPPVEHVYTGIPSIPFPKGDSIRTDRMISSPGHDLDISKPSTKSQFSALMIMRRNGSFATSISEENRTSRLDDSDSLVSATSIGEKPHSHPRTSSFREDRDAFLEQTKNRSWANLAGYDVCDRKNSDRGVQNKDWLSTSNTSNRSIGSAGRSHSQMYAQTDYSIEHTAGSRSFHSTELTRENPYKQYAQYAGRLKRNSSITEFESLADDFREFHKSNSASHHPHVIVEPSRGLDEIQPASHPDISVENKSMLVVPSSRPSKVVFSTVEVRQYERVLGDNPAVSSGPPLAIGWNFYEERTICLPVDEFEYYHSDHRDDSDMVLSRYERESTLLDLGYTQKEIANIIRINYRLKKNRRQTVNNLPVMAVEEMVEKAKRSVSRIIPGRNQHGSNRLYKEWKSRNSESDFDAASSMASPVTKSCLKTI